MLGDHAAPTVALERAHEFSRSLTEKEGVLGVAVFGSVARGTVTGSSDVDLLVLTTPSGPTRRTLVQALPSALRDSLLTLLRYDPLEFRTLMEAGTSFAMHLRAEAKVLSDPTGLLGSLLAARVTSRVPIREELDAELELLSAFEDLDVFRENFLFVLARLYGVGKAVVMLGLVAEGAPAFDRAHAFAKFRSRHPELAAPLQVVERLRPFYLLVSRRDPGPLPFSYRGCRDEVVETVAAVRRIAAVVG